MEFGHGDSLWDITILGYVPSMLIAGLAVLIAVVATRRRSTVISGWSMLVAGGALLVGQRVIHPLEAGPAWSLLTAFIKVNMIASGLMLGAIGLVLLLNAPWRGRSLNDGPRRNPPETPVAPP